MLMSVFLLPYPALILQEFSPIIVHYENAVLIIQRLWFWIYNAIYFKANDQIQGIINQASYIKSSVINTREEKMQKNTDADAFWFEDVNCPCLQSATDMIAVDSHISCDRHNAIHCFYTWMTWILHSLSNVNLFNSWQFMLYYSTLLVLIIRLKSFLHEINWNFEKPKHGLLFSKQLEFSWLWD